MNIYQFMSDSPFVTVLVVWAITECVFKVWNRLMRHLNIRAHGWPPPHCDADGDFREVEEEGEDGDDSKPGHSPSVRISDREGETL